MSAALPCCGHRPCCGHPPCCGRSPCCGHRPALTANWFQPPRYCSCPASTRLPVPTETPALLSALAAPPMTPEKRLHPASAPIPNSLLSRLPYTCFVSAAPLLPIHPAILPSHSTCLLVCVLCCTSSLVPCPPYQAAKRVLQIPVACVASWRELGRGACMCVALSPGKLYCWC